MTYGGANLVQSVDNYNYGGGGVFRSCSLTNAPNLAPLGNYGGPTQTMPPLPGLLAIDAGSVAANTFTTDQRGYSRTQNGLIDSPARWSCSRLRSQPAGAGKPHRAHAGGGNGLQFTFTSASAADFTVLTADRRVVGVDQLDGAGRGPASRAGPVSLRTDPQAATNLVRFYRVRSP